MGAYEYDFKQLGQGHGLNCSEGSQALNPKQYFPFSFPLSQYNPWIPPMLSPYIPPQLRKTVPGLEPGIVQT